MKMKKKRKKKTRMKMKWKKMRRFPLSVEVYVLSCPTGWIQSLVYSLWLETYLEFELGVLQSLQVTVTLSEEKTVLMAVV